MPIETIHVIVNPASGKDEAVLAVLNRVFRRFDVAWTLSVTKKEYDAERQAEEALRRDVDVIAAYGGDGTITAVASVLSGTQTPLAILPGGTANVFAQELSLPRSLEKAARLAAGEQTMQRRVDVGMVNGHRFLLRMGIGLEAQMIAHTDRELKSKYGIFAYLMAAAQNALTLQPAHYRLTIDGEEIEVDAITCGISNSGHVGIGFSISPRIKIDDGYLDVFAIRPAALPDVTQRLTHLMALANSPAAVSEAVRNVEWLRLLSIDSVFHRQAKEIIVRTEKNLPVQYDGELFEGRELLCRVRPRALNVLVPRTHYQ